MNDVLPSPMRAVEIATRGGPEVLRIAGRPVPRPAAGENIGKIALRIRP